MIAEIFRTNVAESAENLAQWLVASVETLLIGAVILLAALLAAAFTRALVRGILARLGLDRWAGGVGLDAVLKGVGVDRRLSDLLGLSAFLVVLLFVAQVAVDTLGLAAVAAALGSILGYAPRVLAAGGILLGGIIAAGYARRVASRAAAESGIEIASTLGSLVFAAITFAVGLIAVNQLQITTDAVWLVLGWLVAGLALALGLSFGLGGRDIVRDILAGFYARRIFEIGREVELQGQRGILVSITPTNALIDQADAVVSIANSRLIAEVVRQPK